MISSETRAEAKSGVDRRSFLGLLGGGFGAGAVALAAARKGFAAQPDDEAAESGRQGFAVSGRKAILYDSTACVGCHYCEAACKNANGLTADVELNVRVLAGTCIPSELFPTGMLSQPAPDPVLEDDRTAKRWLRVVEAPYASDGGASAQFRRCSCTHCGACAAVCPSGALKRRDDGVVSVEPDRCIGCKYCFQACPYDIPRFAEGPEDRAMHKCTMCSARLDEGKLPACVDACPAGALSYGSWEGVQAAAEGIVAALADEGRAGYLHAADTALVTVLEEA